MKKAVVLFLVVALVGLSLGSCEKEVVTYCPFCGQANLKEVSEVDLSATPPKSEIYYECQNSECGKKFLAGKVKSL
jgi:hypothetical protein